jgi:hypothetical protein
MICAKCYSVLRGHEGAQWRGTYDLHFDHHVDRLELEKSANMSCCICRSILREISRVEKKSQEGFVQRDALREVEQTGQESTKQNSHEDNVGGWSRLFSVSPLIRIIIGKLGGQSTPVEQRTSEGRGIVDDFETSENHSILRKQQSLVTAYLSEVYDKHYRLDFKWRDSENVGTFILQKISESPNP